MKQITLHISNEHHNVLSALAAVHTGGNVSAMVRRVFDERIMPQDYEIYRRRLEPMLVAADAKHKTKTGCA